MAEYKVFFRKSVYKDFDGIPKEDLRKIIEKISSLAHSPRPHGSQKLSGQERYRIRQGNYRIIYSIQDDELTIWVVQVGHRKEVYR